MVPRSHAQKNRRDLRKRSDKHLRSPNVRRCQLKRSQRLRRMTDVLARYIPREPRTAAADENPRCVRIERGSRMTYRRHASLIECRLGATFEPFTRSCDRRVVPTAQCARAAVEL